MEHRYGENARPDFPLAVVVGAGAMGMATARRLAQRYRILVVDIDPEKADEAAKALSEEGGHAKGLGCDVTEVASVQSLAQEVAEQGGLGALAHVAALSPSAGDFEKIVRVNLTGPALVSDALLPHCRPGSAAVFVSSLAAHTFRGGSDFVDLLGNPTAADLADRLAERLGARMATPGMAYAFSKWAMLHMVRRKAVAWGERGARIVSLSPGMIATPMGAREFQNSAGKRELFAKTPLKREGTLHEIADAMDFLLSERASFITGTDLLVDGGLAAAVSSAAPVPTRNLQTGAGEASVRPAVDHVLAPNPQES